MDDVVCRFWWSLSYAAAIYHDDEEQVLDMGLQMSGVYQVWHHDIFLPEEEWVVPHYVLRDVASSARAFVMRNGGQNY